MSPEMGTLLMFGTMVVLLFSGVHVAFALGVVALVFSLILMGPSGLLIAIGHTHHIWANPSLLAFPLFIFMANVLERSGVVEAGFEMAYRWFGGIRGGLAAGCVFLCIIFAATVGSGTVGIVTIGLIATPLLLNRGYDKRLTVGSIMSGSVLGIVIPPSVSMILYGLVTRLSIGKLYFGGVVPGIVTGSLIMAYTLVRSYFQPHLAPAIPKEYRVSLKEKILSLKYMILPIFLIITVLGSIWFGICTASEAGGIGAVGAIVCAAVSRHLNWKMIKEASMTSMKLLGMAGWMVAASMMFNAVYMTTGARDMVEGFIIGTGINPWHVLIMMNLSLLLMGALVDEWAIIVLLGPIFQPIVVSLGFDPLWWGIIFILNMQISFLTPPYGFSLYFMRAIIPQMQDKFPKGVKITTNDILFSIPPFLALQIVGLIGVMVFPSLATWFPGIMPTK